MMDGLAGLNAAVRLRRLETAPFTNQEDVGRGISRLRRFCSESVASRSGSTDLVAGAATMRQCHWSP
jgi:hypothetical protein